MSAIVTTAKIEACSRRPRCGRSQSARSRRWSRKCRSALEAPASCMQRTQLLSCCRPGRKARRHHMIAVMALSTSKLNEMIERAERDALKKSMLFIACITGRTIAIVEGIRQRDHRARPQAEADDADRHDDGDRLPERFHELADGGLNHDRLVEESATSSKPSGRLATLSSIAFFTLRPSARTSPPSRMAMARPSPTCR